jgi:hypothetical protein
MGNMGASNFVVEEVDESPRIHFVIWAVDCVEGTLDEVVICIGKVWDVNIGVLEPVYFANKKYMLSIYVFEIKENPALHSVLTKCKEPTMH